MNDTIDISKLDKAEVLAALYNNSRQQVIPFLAGREPLTKEEAAELLKQTTYFGYLAGRVMKVDLKGDTLDPRLYDRDNGLGAAASALHLLMANSTGSDARNSANAEMSHTAPIMSTETVMPQETPCSAFLDEAPITTEWLLECGFKPVESGMGKEYSDHMEKGLLNIWEFGNTGDWLFDRCDSFAMRTRGRLRMLAHLIGEETGVMERICPHGVGHPDPDDAAHNIRIGRDYMTVHGCDGCCSPNDKAQIRPAKEVWRWYAWTRMKSTEPMRWIATCWKGDTKEQAEAKREQARMEDVDLILVRERTEYRPNDPAQAPTL